MCLKMFAKYVLISEVFPVPFEGCKLLINKGLSNHFQISHTLTMSTLQPSGYKFGCTYVGTKQYGPMEVGQKFPITRFDIQYQRSFQL